MQAKKSLIIIGGGMTGLSAGLTWALNNDLKQRPVCLLEKEPVTGGSVITYTRQGYRFDTCQMISNLAPVFEYFGLNVPFKEFQGTFGRVYLADTHYKTAKVIELPAGEERFKEHICTLYPREATKFIRFFEYSRAMFHELYALKYAPNAWEKIQTLLACPKIVRHAGETFEQYLANFHLDHPEILEILRLFVIMSGWPESRVAALLPIGVMFSLLEKAFRPAGSFAELPQHMEARFRALGGEVRLKTKVERLWLHDGRVCGVYLANGEVLPSEYVISTVDVRHAAADLIGLDALRTAHKGYALKMVTAPMTPSSMTINLGLDDKLDLGALGCDCGYTMLTTGGDAFEHLFAAAERGETIYSDKCFHVGVICPTLVTGGKPVVTISVFPMPLGEWRHWRETDPELYKRKKERMGDFFVGLVDQYIIPGLRRHIVVRDISTPATYARYSGSPSGAIYDMASEPNNFGLKRLRMDTPIKGLYQPKFAHGVFGTITGGMQAVDMIMDRKILQGNSRFLGKAGAS